MHMSPNSQSYTPCYDSNAVQDGHAQGIPTLAQSQVEGPSQVLRAPEYHHPSPTTPYSAYSSSQHSLAWSHNAEEVNEGVQILVQDYANSFDEPVVIPSATEMPGFASSAIPVTSTFNSYDVEAHLHPATMSTYSLTPYSSHSVPPSPLPSDSESNYQAVSIAVSSPVSSIHGYYVTSHSLPALQPSPSLWHDTAQPLYYRYPEPQHESPTYRDAGVQAPGSPAQVTSEPSYSGVHSSDQSMASHVDDPPNFYENTISSYQSSTDQSMGTSAGSRPSAQNHATIPSAVAIDQPASISNNLWHQLNELSLYLVSQPWLRLNEPEPLPIADTEILPCDPKIKRSTSSRFDFFFEPNGSHHCRWIINGKRCNKTFTRKDLAQDHIRNHFEYAPFKCPGTCGTIDCTVKYHSQTRLNGHVKRTQKPKKECEICGKSFTIQNYARHMKRHMGVNPTSTST